MLPYTRPSPSNRALISPGIVGSAARGAGGQLRAFSPGVRPGVGSGVGPGAAASINGTVLTFKTGLASIVRFGVLAFVFLLVKSGCC
jgi:hypothetical protein